MNSAFQPTTGYRDGTINLIILGDKNDLQDFEEVAKNSEFYKVIEGVPYARMASIIDKNDPIPIVYVAVVNDRYGEKLQRIARKVHNYFAPFDSVDALFYDKGFVKTPEDAILIPVEIKENGEYLDIYRTLEVS